MDPDILEDVLIPLVAIVLGSMIFLIPIAGLTARFALKPIMEAVSRMKSLQGQSPDSTHEIALLDQRIALLEQQVQGMETTIEQLEATRNFDRQLHPGS